LIGVTGQRHYTSAFALLDEPLYAEAGDDGPTAANAIVERDYRLAIKGDEKALARSLRRLLSWELAQIRKRNKQPQVLYEIENYDFERIDQALEVLGIVETRTIQWGKRTLEGMNSSRERIGNGIADWVLEAARGNRAIRSSALFHVRNWMESGAFGISRDYEEWFLDKNYYR
jgi:hypothetical protein